MAFCNYCDERGPSFSVCTTEEQRKKCKMTAPAKPTIDEQFPNLSALAQGAMSGNITEWPQLRVEAERILQWHKRITEAAGRPEPVARNNMLRLRNGFFVKADGSEEPTYGHYVTEADYDNLLAYADRVAAERDEAVRRMEAGWLQVADSGIAHYKERAETAERRLAELQAKHNRLFKAAAEIQAEHAIDVDDPKGDGCDICKAVMSAVALDKGGE